MTEESMRCAACGGNRLTWRVRRARISRTPVPERSLVWSCRDCGGDRVRLRDEEPLEREGNAAVPH